jgi:hypothetical protein
MLLLVPILVREWPLLQQQIPLLFDKLDAALKPLLGQLGITLSLDLSELKNQLVQYLSANRDDWWAPLIGPGRALDTTRTGVLCANLLGGCYGSTGPASLNPFAAAVSGRTLRRD